MSAEKDNAASTVSGSLKPTERLKHFDWNKKSHRLALSGIISISILLLIIVTLVVVVYESQNIMLHEPSKPAGGHVTDNKNSRVSSASERLTASNIETDELYFTSTSNTTKYSTDVIKDVDIFKVETEVDVEVEGDGNVMVSRSEWGAVAPLYTEDMEHPVPYVVISQSNGRSCYSRKSCVRKMEYLQTFHMESLHLPDIGYNFCVGGDGAIYEARGWDVINFHEGFVKGRSVGLCFLGDFSYEEPSDAQMQAAWSFLERATRLGQLSPDYKLVAHNQIALPQSLLLGPGFKLLSRFNNYEHRCFINCDDSNGTATNIRVTDVGKYVLIFFLK